MKKELIDYLSFKRKYLNDVKKVFEKTSLKEAIEKAAKAEDLTNNGKMFSHQRRIGSKKASEGYKKLKDKEEDFRVCNTFEDIMLITNKVMMDIYRLGPLWSYDTALRIGFHLKVYPSDVYIQAGVVKGLKKYYPHLKPQRKIAKSDFIGLESLEPYEIENFLCVFGGKRNKPIC
ncbi:MAG: hypothetical protein QM710_06015 [Flavobacterium sp.]